MGKKTKEKKSKIASICLNIIHFSTYLILFTPLIISSKFFFPFVGPKSLYFMGLAEIAFFAWLILIFVSPKYRPQFNFLLAALVFYLFILILATIFGVSPSYSFWSKYERMAGILMMLHLFSFFLILSSVFKEKDFKRIFAVSNFVAVIIGFIALTSQNPAMRGGATLGNDSFMGTYLLFNLFFAIYLILKSREELKIFSLTSFLIIGLILLRSQARAAKLSFLGGIVLLMFFWLVSQKRKLKWIGVSLLILVFISVAYFTFSALQPESFVRKNIIEKVIGKTFGGRFIVWQGAWKGFLERPWLGWGPENFEFSFTKYFDACMPTPECGTEVWFDRAHNIFFDTIVSSGVLGLISYFLIFVVSFYILWKNYLSNKIDFWTVGIFSSLFISYSVQNLTVFDMVSSYMMLFLSLGFIASFERKRGVSEETKRINPAYLILILVFFLFSFLSFVILPTIADSYTIFAIQSSPWSDQRLSLYKKVLVISPLGKFQIREFFTESALQSLISEREFNEKVKAELDFLAQELEKSVKECPVNFRSYLKLGQLYNLYSVFDSTKISEAERVSKKAIELSPANQQAYWTLAQNMLYQGKFEEAFSLVEKAVELEPNLERSHAILIEIARILGDFELAEKKIQEAIKINPEWENDLRKILTP
ncbi:hypothetical protein AMJ49_03055 [Parcubacteria bacterium DG_74_2]|nr:MAG: hypothetical protein AMJ49_03055 [Parcubacteria bacterium DG_74_2]